MKWAGASRKSKANKERMAVRAKTQMGKKKFIKYIYFRFIRNDCHAMNKHILLTEWMKTKQMQDKIFCAHNTHSYAHIWLLRQAFYVKTLNTILCSVHKAVLRNELLVHFYNSNWYCVFYLLLYAYKALTRMPATHSEFCHLI